MQNKSVPYYKKEAEYTCGPASCRMVLAYFGINNTEQELVNILQTTLHKGTSPQNIKRLFDQQSFSTFLSSDIIERTNIITKITSLLSDGYLIIALVNRLTYDVVTPLVDTKVEWENPNESLHYIVISSVSENSVTINDPHVADWCMSVATRIFPKILDEFIYRSKIRELINLNIITVYEVRLFLLN